MRDGQQVLTGPTALQDAQRKARYGHRDWVYYHVGDVAIAKPVTVDSLKEAMLACGTRMNRNGRYCHIVGSDGNCYHGAWWLLNNIRRQRQMGWV